VAALLAGSNMDMRGLSARLQGNIALVDNTLVADERTVTSIALRGDPCHFAPMRVRCCKQHRPT
jgi:hypothetical protein